ncbi:MAG: prepilin-type N-terminal cleavage/methylation domain-containing protein [Kiritimatiellae bacterium]|nr:prepilin-type N-terminal cleavage/methylation domain-containing protein [Kiritimatiellia bacterium]
MSASVVRGGWSRRVDRRRAMIRRAFTLVELLVVVGIMGMMLAITVVAFEGIGRGAKMRAALMTIKSTLALARQYSITDRTLCFVVFPDDQVNFSAVTNLGATRYSAMFIGTTARWSRMLAKWYHLPRGIVFDRDRQPPAYPRVLNVFDRSNTNNVSGIPFPIEASNQVDQLVACMRFHPNGRLHQPDAMTDPAIIITEGTIRYDPSTSALLEYFKQPNAPAYMIEVRPLTGRTKITELPPNP